MKILSILAIILYLRIFSQQTTVPSSDCAAISDKGRCYNSFTSSGINWQDARDMCIALGGDLATVTSLEEHTMLLGIKRSSCWIGLNDIDVEGTFVWVDGSKSTYRQWSQGQPDNHQSNESCVENWYYSNWNDRPCGFILGCYYCSTTVSPFGEQISPNTYTPLRDNSFLYRNTTLYCITETKNTPQVTWSYTDLNGVSTTLSATTNATTGVSTLYVTNDKPGYYSCVVSQNGGNTTTYTTVMQDFIIGAPVLTLNYRSCNAFSLLPPAVNRADIPVLTQNVILSANLVGRWQTPNGSYVDSDSIRIPTLYLSHAGLYKFYVTNWYGVWTLAIQIDISPVGSQSTNPDTTTESPTNTEPSLSYTLYTIIAVLAIFVSILYILVLLICVFFVCAMKRSSSRKVNSRDNQLQLPQIDANETYEQIDTTHLMANNNKSTLFAESVNSESKENKLDLKVPVYDNSDVTSHRYANTVF